MDKLQTIEQQIVAEYGVVRGWIATHLTLSLGIALAAGLVIGLLF